MQPGWLGSLYIPSKIDFTSCAAAIATDDELKENSWSGSPVSPTATMAAAAILFVAIFMILVLRLYENVLKILIKTSATTSTQLLFIVIISL